MMQPCAYCAGTEIIYSLKDGATQTTTTSSLAMSKPASPWSMVGRFMGNSRLHSPSRRRKEKEPDQVAATQDKENPDLAVTLATKAGGTASTVDPVEDEMSESGQSLADEHQYTEITRPTTPTEQEQEWTQVVKEQNRCSVATSTTESEGASAVLEEDMVDIISQSVSGEFLDQEARAPPRDVEHLDAELRRKEAEILAFENEKRESESRLENTLRNLQSAEENNRQLEAENRRQAEELQVQEVHFRALQDNKMEMKRTLDVFEGEKGLALQRVRQLEDSLSEELERISTMERRLRKTEMEWSENKEQLDTAARTIQELQAQIEHLSQERDDKDRRIRRIQYENAETTDKLDATIAELAATMRHTEELEDELHQLTEELRKRETTQKDLWATQAMLLHNPNHRFLENLERRNRMLADQIRLQSAQLRQQSLPRFTEAPQDAEQPIKTNISGGIIGIVDRLNSEIFQAAAHMADSLEFEGREWKTLEIKGILERASLTMGRPMVLAMHAISARSDAGVNTLPVQIALQACMVSCCRKIISSWYPGHWEYGDFLETLHSRIQGSDSTNAKKWRALTQSQLRQASDRQVQSEMMDFLLRNLIDALVVSGWKEVESTRMRKLADFQERLSLAVKLALRLNGSIGDEWEALVVHPTEQFNPEIMEDAYGGEEDRWEDIVICTTDIGLKMATRGILSKPKVVLRSTIMEETGYDSFQ